MLPDRVSNPGPLTYESCALPIALRGPAQDIVIEFSNITVADIVSSTIKSFDSFCTFRFNMYTPLCHSATFLLNFINMTAWKTSAV